ncbi:MAG TPA: DUF4292 domain-containing protein [Bacteroidales bacterium]|mgnify:FL=1|jgi:hypothetical protein|nr:DUF4292 domain-containing protein [Bacteroidales bacterium]
MPEAVKYAVVISLILLMTGCAAMKKRRTTVKDELPADVSYSAVMRGVTSNNITGRGFEIRKGSIELEGTEVEGKFGLLARLNSKGDFYGSVRGPLGIELVRILMVGDDIAVIDRFNRKIYIGKKEMVLRKNGMPSDFMTIIFGDIPEEDDVEMISADRNEIVVSSGNEDFNRLITICLDYMKVCNQRINANVSDNEIYMQFGKFSVSGGKKYPSEIMMEEREKMFHVKLSIDELIYGYDSDIEFRLPSYKKESF